MYICSVLYKAATCCKTYEPHFQFIFIRNESNESDVNIWFALLNSNGIWKKPDSLEQPDSKLRNFKLLAKSLYDFGIEGKKCSGLFVFLWKPITIVLSGAKPRLQWQCPCMMLAQRLLLFHIATGTLNSNTQIWEQVEKADWNGKSERRVNNKFSLVGTSAVFRKAERVIHFLFVCLYEDTVLNSFNLNNGCTHTFPCLLAPSPLLHPQHAHAAQYCEMVQWSLSL